VNEQATPLCVTLKVCPATVKLPDRWLVDVFAAAEYLTEPVPVPLAPEVTVIQLVLLAAVQPHDPPVVTVMVLLVEADAPTD